MRIHHKQPTLVSMWMLDVFCCALGCVSLLFLLNSRMAADQAEKNQAALLDLDATRQQLQATLLELDKLQRRYDAETHQLTTQLAALRSNTDDLSRRLSLARDEAKATRALLDATQNALTAAEAKLETQTQDLRTLRDKLATADDLLRKKQTDTEALAKKLTESTTAYDDLNRLLRKKDEERLLLQKQTAELQKQLADLEAKLLAARNTAAQNADEMARLRKKDAEELTEARAQVKDLLKKIDEARATIIDLQGDKQKLADQFDKFQKETEARFAGIVTTGRRVVFVVDISGSMAKKDAETADPTKWPIVVETVIRVMRSVAGLEKYQVVVFSSSARWLFGNGQWVNYVGQKSLDEVQEALLKVKPYDDTNLYAGLELAFQLREAGLDSIYLFSDGLPTSGPGLTRAEETRKPPLTELELGERLGRHIRRTLQDDWNRPLLAHPRVKIHAIGFYFESPDVGAFLWALARENNGSFVGMSRP
jgi:predicted  nucleic acid-binding Zn-ribbon protein